MSTPLFTRCLHPTWYELIQACHDASIARDLSPSALSEELGVRGVALADPERFVAILAKYYLEVEPHVAMVRRGQDGFVAVRFGESLNAMRWLARLVGAAPQLRGVSVERRPELSLTRGGWVARLHDEMGWVELAEVVEAANSLLAVRGDERFVPLLGTRAHEAYVRVDFARAAILDAAGLLEADWITAFDLDQQRRAA
ncbi:MAG: hypothetical protein AB7P00_08945 [Sandaracinaceae bacterium]